MKTYSNNKHQQEQRELRQTESFLNKLNLNHTNLTQLAEDPPDFTFVLNDKKIALEHTSLYDKIGQKDKQLEKLKESIVKEISTLYYLENLTPISVFFVFNGKLNLQGNKRRELIVKLLKFFKEIQYEIPITDYDYIDIDYDKLPEEISKLTITKIPAKNLISWSPDNSWWTKKNLIEVVDQQIKKKNKALVENKYKLEFDEAWLLLIIENNVGSEWELPTEIISKCHHNFKRVYIFESLYSGFILVEPEN